MSAMPMEPFLVADDREHRDRRLLRAMIWCQEIGEQDALVRNISRSGLGGTVSRTPLAPRMYVVITLIAGLQIPGTVKWTRGAAFGLRLREQVDLDLLASEMRKQIAAQLAEGEWEVPSRHQHQHHRHAPPGPVRRV